MKAKFLSGLFLFSVLFISCSKDDDSSTPADDGDDQNTETISTFTDIVFSLDDSSKYFSTSEGKMYSKSEITAESTKVIDLVGDSNQTFIAFSSPSKTSEISGGTVTKIQHLDTKLTVTNFDDIKDDSTLKNLSVTDDNDSVGITGYKEKIIIFENAAGKKGVIKLKAINADRVLVDIKVMK
jgi:hypothetical protein